MMTPMQKIAFVVVVCVLACGAGLFALMDTQHSAAMFTVVDGQKFYKTRDAGWQPVTADVSVDLAGNVETNYARVAALVPFELPKIELPKIDLSKIVIPFSLPNTSGQCGEDSGISCE